MNEKITFTQEPNGGYVGVCSPSIDSLVIDGQHVVVTNGMLAVNEVPKEVLVVMSRYNHDKLLHYADIHDRNNIITIEKAQEIAGLGGKLGDEYYPVYALEKGYRQAYIEVRQNQALILSLFTKLRPSKNILHDTMKKVISAAC